MYHNFSKQPTQLIFQLNSLLWHIIVTYALSFYTVESTGPKMFWAGPNFLSQSKNLIAFSVYSKKFVPAQKPNLLNGNHLLAYLGLAQKFYQFLVRPKKFGPAQNILEPIEGQNNNIVIRNFKMIHGFISSPFESPE